MFNLECSISEIGIVVNVLKWAERDKTYLR